MWEKISKEMALPWRAAEAMHWQIGEVEMAQRANVPVFHLAGQQASHVSTPSDSRPSTTSPSSFMGTSPHMPYSHMHNHGLPPLPPSLPQSMSPVRARLRRNSSSSSTTSTATRLRADSARSMPTSTPRGLLPPVSEITGPPPGYMRYGAPFVGARHCG